MTALNSRDIEAFLTIAEELSFRRAAQRLNIDQSALSRRVQGLEEQLRYQLIFRTTREVKLTEAGRVFYEQVAPAMQSIARAEGIARVAAEGKTGRLRIGYMSFAAAGVMPDRVGPFAAAYPDIALELRYLRTQAQKLALSRGEIDCGFMLGPFQNPQFEQIKIADDRLVAMLPVDHPLAAADSITLAELSQCRLVLGSYDQWDFFRHLVDDVFHSAGLEARAAYEPTNTLGILGLVSHGLGVSIGSQAMQRIVPPDVRLKPISDCTTTLTTILAWDRANQSPALRNFVRLARKKR